MTIKPRQVREHLRGAAHKEDLWTAPSLAHPSTDDHDGTIDAHYSCLERPHACTDGVVFVGHLVVADDGEEVEVFDAVPCGRCAAVDR
jgi:hypothetical protein